MIVSTLTGKNMQTLRKFFKIIDRGVVDHTFLKPFNGDCVSKTVTVFQKIKGMKPLSAGVILSQRPILVSCPNFMWSDAGSHSKTIVEA